MGTVLTDPPSVENLFNSVVPSDLNADVYKKFKQFLLDNKVAFAFKPKDLGTTGLIKYEIQLLSDIPIRMRPYPIAFKHHELVRKHIEDMLKGNIIQPSTSPFAFGVVLVDKKDGNKGFCVNY